MLIRCPRILAASLIVALALAAQAEAITYDFTVTGDAANPPATGPLTASGTVSFDSSELGAPGSMLSGAGLITQLSFNWNGQRYSILNAGSGSVYTNSSGQFGGIIFGSDCNGASCDPMPSFDSRQLPQSRSWN